MKLLHVANRHFRSHWFEWIAAQAQHYDAVCVAGDLLDMFGTAKTSLRAQAKWARDWDAQDLSDRRVMRQVRDSRQLVRSTENPTDKAQRRVRRIVGVGAEPSRGAAPTLALVT
jgi:hypothetical protein